MLDRSVLRSVPVVLIGPALWCDNCAKGVLALSSLPGLEYLSQTALPPASVETRLTPHRRWQLPALAHLWQYRELLGFLSLRDIQVRYKQTVLGALWAVMQPVAMMIVLTALRSIMGNGGDQIPVFIFAALLPWTFFAASVTASTNSLVTNAHMLRKIYFPRLIIPVAAIGAPLLDFAIAFGVLAAIMWWFNVAFTFQLLLLPILIVTTLIAALGVGVMLSALTVTPTSAVWVWITFFGCVGAA
jgi:lipopolysaccharide transport system permease protein